MTGLLVRVVVADDSPVFLEAAVDVVAVTPGFELAGTASSGEDAIVLVGTVHPDLVLMDVRMPGLGGIEAALRIRSAHPDVVVVMLTADSTMPREHEALPSLSKQALSSARLAEVWERHSAPAPRA